MKTRLSDSKCKQKSKAKPYKLGDGGGLFLLINPDGGKWWRFSYQFAGKQKTISLGVYPDVSLDDARQACLLARRDVASGIDPSQKRKAERVMALAGTPFAVVAEDWFSVKMTNDRNVAETTQKRNRSLLGHLLRNDLANRAIGAIEPPEVLALLRRMEASGLAESAHRVMALASRIFQFGIQTGLCTRNPAADLAGALTAQRVTPRPALIDPVAVGELMRKIDGYDGGRGPFTRWGMQFLALTLVRPGEQRKAEWIEFGDLDADDPVWTIPAAKMKMRSPHKVPLSRQAVALLKEVHDWSGAGQYVFSPTRLPMSECTVNKALRSLGYDTAKDHCAHGFRATASTLLNAEHKGGMPIWNPDVIELSLAHVESSVRKIYNRSPLWPERVKLMQHWADRLDTLRMGAEIVPIRKRA